MSPEERELLTKAIKLSEENNKILRGMRRSARLSSFFRLAYWTVIIIVTIAGYMIIQPYIQAAMKGYAEMQKGIQTISNTTSKLPDLPKLPSWLGGE